MAVKKQASKKSSSSNEMKSPSVSKSAGSNSSLLNWVLIIVVVQALMTLGIILMLTSSNSTPAGVSSSISNIEDKVEKIDAFFSTYVDGYGDGSAAPSTNTQTGSPSASDNLVADIENEPFRGDINAPVTVVEFSDFQCPYCEKFYTESFAKIKENYVDKGLVKFVYKDFPLSFHPMAAPAAVAANCVYKLAGDEVYFQYHDTLFENQNLLSQDNFAIWAENLGVSASDFETCLQDQSIIAEIQQDLAEGQSLGVSGTPSFIINGELVVGAQPYSVLSSVIESKLNE